MAAKAIIFLCAQALVIQAVVCQCFGHAPYASGIGAPYGWAGCNWGYDGIGYGAPYGWADRGWGFDGIYDWPARSLGLAGSGLDFTSTSGGSLVVTSASPIPPTGISIVSDNAYEGILSVAGEVPFIGTTAMEGALPTVGAGAINYGCGSGITAMVTEVISPIGTITPLVSTIAPTFAPTTGIGCGCEIY